MLLEELKSIRNINNDQNMFLKDVLCEGADRLMIEGTNLWGLF